MILNCKVISFICLDFVFYFIQTSAPLFRVCNYVDKFLRILNKNDNNNESLNRMKTIAVFFNRKGEPTSDNFALSPNKFSKNESDRN